VFKGLGRVGVFYGNRLGHHALAQRVSLLLVPPPAIRGRRDVNLGFFIAMRYPAPDWLALPLLEAVYYVAGARLEQDERS
jgi:hypothetical protein